MHQTKKGNPDWYIADMPSQVKALKKYPRINKMSLKTEYLKAGIWAEVEHPFRIIKCQFGFAKSRYCGLMKNDNRLAMLFTVRVD